MTGGAKNDDFERHPTTRWTCLTLYYVNIARYPPVIIIVKRRTVKYPRFVN